MLTSGDIIAIGAGRALMQEPNNPLHDYVLDLSSAIQPSVGFLPTASGDDQDYIKHFNQTYKQRNCSTDSLLLFYREVVDLKNWFDQQDIIYVGGGNTANMLAVWRIHGVDQLLKSFLERGGIVCGGSAGAICWFNGGITDSFSPNNLQPLNDGLKFLDGSVCPHYDSELNRPKYYHDAIKKKLLEPGYGVDNFAALHFRNGQLLKSLASKPGSQTYRVDENCIQTPLEMTCIYAKQIEF